MSKVVFVTGATGFLGKHLCQALLMRGDRVIALEHDRAFHYPVRLDGYAPYDQRFDIVRGDVRDGDFIKRVLTRHEVEVVVHLASQSQVGVAEGNAQQTYDVNMRGTWEVLNACDRIEIRKLIVASSDKVYGECENATEESPIAPKCPYSVSKACCDQLALAWGDRTKLQVAVTRCGNLYGPGDTQWRRIVPDAMRAAILRTTLKLRTDGTEVRDYLYVGNAVEAYLKLIDGTDTGAFNFSGGTPVRVRDIISFVETYFIRKLSLEVGEATELRWQSLNCDKAKSILKWEPQTSLSSGFVLAAKWYENWLTGARP